MASSSMADILVRIEANTAQLRGELKRAETDIVKTSGRIDASLSGINAKLSMVGTGIKAALGTAAVGTIAAVAGSVVQTAMSFEKLRASLVTVTGSAEGADRAFKEIQAFAKTTPYGVEEVTRAFIKLKAMGLDPSQEALTAYGNTAGAMSKSLNDMVEAVADAANGEFERLREFGIRASKQGDEIQFTFDDVTTNVKNNSADIQKYLMDIGNVNFAGGMQRQSETLDGKFQALKDSVSNLADEFMKGGLLDALKETADKMGEASDQAPTFARNLGEMAAEAVRILGEDLKRGADRLQILMDLAGKAKGFLSGSDSQSPLQQLQASEKHWQMMEGDPQATDAAENLAEIRRQISAEQARLVNEQLGIAGANYGDVPPVSGDEITAANRAAQGLGTGRRRGVVSGSAGSFGGITNRWEPVDTTEKSTGTKRSTTPKRDPVADTLADLKFEEEQLYRNEAAQKAYAAARAAGTSIDSAAGQEMLRLSEAIQLEKDKREANTELIQREADLQKQLDDWAAEGEKEKTRLKKEGEQVTIAVRTAQESYNVELERLGHLLDKDVISMETFNRASEKASEDLYKSQNKVAESTNNARDSFMQFGQITTSAFEDAILEGAKLSDIMKGLMKDMARMAIRQGINGLFNFAANNMFGPAPGRASGGAVEAGKGYWVGEHGKEWFRPSTSGSIVPNSQAEGGGGAVINMSWNIDAKNATMTPAQFGAVIQAASAQAVKDVAALAGQGGGFSKAVGRRK